jgi:hypothetical protein
MQSFNHSLLTLRRNNFGIGRLAWPRGSGLLARTQALKASTRFDEFV